MIRFPLMAILMALPPLAGILFGDLKGVIGLSAIGSIYAIMYLAQTIAEKK